MPSSSSSSSPPSSGGSSIPAAIATGHQAEATVGSIATTLAKTELISPPATPGHTLLQLRGGTMFDVSAEELLQQMESFNREGVKSMSPELRARLSDAARKLSVDVERPEDVVSRVLVTQVSFPGTLTLTWHGTFFLPVVVAPEREQRRRKAAFRKVIS
jgi:hypothetical protein